MTAITAKISRWAKVGGTKMYTFSVWTEYNSWEDETWNFYILVHNVNKDDEYETSVDFLNIGQYLEIMESVSDLRYKGLKRLTIDQILALDDEDKDEYGCLGSRPKNTFLQNFDLQRLKDTLSLPKDEAQKTLYKGGLESFGEGMVEYVYDVDEEEIADD